MGLEADCIARRGRRKHDVHAHLDTKTLQLRGDLSLDIPFSGIRSVEARRGALIVNATDGRLTLELGDAAEKWALKIRYPKRTIDKLGVKPDMKVSVLKIDDEVFWSDLTERTTDVSRRVRKNSEMIFLGVTAKQDLDRLSRLEESIARDGAIWVVWPKGRKELREDDVRAAAKASGLVDVKVCAFSETLSALKLVIPKARR